MHAYPNPHVPYSIPISLWDWKGKWEIVASICNYTWNYGSIWERLGTGNFGKIVTDATVVPNVPHNMSEKGIALYNSKTQIFVYTVKKYCI